MESLLSNKDRGGQSLIELLIAMTVGIILLTGTAMLFGVSVQSTVQNKYFQTASFFGQGLMERLTTFAQYRWYCGGVQDSCGIYQLKKGSPAVQQPQPGNKYYLEFDGTKPLLRTVGPEIKIMNGINYARYFYLENVCRASDGSITGITNGNGTAVGDGACKDAGGDEDPSIQKATIVVYWNDNVNTNISFSKFITRSATVSFIQTDWSGGPTVLADPPDPAVLEPDDKFFFSQDIDYASASGTIKSL